MNEADRKNTHKKNCTTVRTNIFISLLVKRKIASIHMVIQIEQMITQLTNIVQILQNNQVVINNIMNFIQNIVNTIEIVLQTPGAPGAQGPAGPQGPPGVISTVYGYIFDNADQDPTKANPVVRFNQFNQPGSVIFGGVVATATSLTVPVAGDYALLWETVFLATDGTHQHAAFGIFVNGTLQDSTRSGVAIFLQQQVSTMNGDAIISLQAGDVITLQALIPPASGQNDIPLTSTVQYPGAIQPINSASLRIFKLR